MKITDEELMAYADGELSPLEAKRIEAAMADDRHLAARVARFRAVRRALRTAYDSVVSEPIPEHLRALLGDVAANEPPVPAPPSTPEAAPEREGPRFALSRQVLVALGVGLLVGVLAGALLF